jgi:hypothetical protein
VGIEVFALSNDVAIRSLAHLSEILRTKPRAVAQEVTRRVAPAITQLARETYNASEDAYGNPWVPGVDGKPVDLYDSGDMFKTLFYVPEGTKVRVRLSVSYAKYQIGKRHIFPTQGGLLPASYSAEISRIAVDVIRKDMFG